MSDAFQTDAFQADAIRSGISDSCLAGKVWLIGGTSESAELALALSERRIPFVVTVTTESARQLYSERVAVVVGTLTPAQMAGFVQQQAVVCILDASHPFAKIVSEGAIAIATQRQIAYIRYEREQVLQNSNCNVLIDTSLVSMLESPQLHNQRILFTLGYRSLLNFRVELSQLRQRSKLFARILPSPEALASALAVGFSADEIVALRPPVSYELEKALWQQWDISLVVAKASGYASGELIKRRIAAELGVHLRLLERPPVTYPCQTHCVLDAVRFCEMQTVKRLD